MKEKISRTLSHRKSTYLKRKAKREVILLLYVFFEADQIDPIKMQIVNFSTKYLPRQFASNGNKVCSALRIAYLTPFFNLSSRITYAGFQQIFPKRRLFYSLRNSKDEADKCSSDTYIKCTQATVTYTYIAIVTGVEKYQIRIREHIEGNFPRKTYTRIINSYLGFWYLLLVVGI